jgi:hypothetical protein
MATIGSQALLRIIPRTRFDLSQLRGATVQIPVAQHVDVLGFERAAVQVRIYRGILPAKSSLDIQIADDGFGGEGFSETFLQTQNSNGDDIGKLHIPDSAIFPFYQSIPIAIPGVIGRMMAVLLSFTGGPEAGPTVELSVDLVLTGGSVGAKVYQPSTYLGYAHETVEPVEAFDPLTSQPTASGDLSEARLAQLLSDAIRKAIAGSRPVFDPPDGGTYARFGNVNVGIADPGRRPDVGEEKLAAVLSSAVQEALLRELSISTRRMEAMLGSAM